MTKKQKAAVLAAGAVVTAAVGAASLPDSAQELVDSTQALYVKSEDRGMVLPESPGIRDVRDGMYDMAPTQGRDMELVISEEGTIEAGDDLTLCHQYKQDGDPLMLLDNATLLAVDTAKYKGTTYAAVVCTHVVDEVPFTYLGVVELGETPKMGGIIPLAEGALPEADVAIIPFSGLVVAVYAKDGIAWAECAQIGDGATLESKGYSDLVTGDPVNLNVAADEFVCFAVSCVRTVEGVPTISVVQGLQEYPDTTIGYSEPIDLTADHFPALKDLSFDPAQAPAKWDLDITAPSPQTETVNFLTDGAAYLSCPKAEGKGHNLITLRTGGEWLHPVSYSARTFDGEVSGGTKVYAGTADTPLANVITTNRNPETGKAWATMSGYALADTYEYPKGRDLVSTKAVTAREITDVASTSNDCPGAISMVADGILYLTAFEIPQCDRGPTQAVAENVARAMLADTWNNTVWCVTQSRDGLLWLTKYVPETVVRKAYSGDTVDGTAIQGGKPGETCKASITRPPDDDYFAPDGGEKEPA